MWKVQIQVTDEEGTHRWQSASPQRFATRQEAEKHSELCCDTFLKVVAPKAPDGLRSARFRVMLAAVAACLVLQ
jgi:hypothetical protein